MGRFGALYPNIHIASNAFIWDDNGKAVGVREPIIHTFNKDYTSVKKHSFFKEVENRKNVILLGDNTGDATMTNGFDYEKIIKIGFLNEKVDDEAVRVMFEKEFDVLILNDGPMDFVYELLREIDG